MVIRLRSKPELKSLVRRLRPSEEESGRIGRAVLRIVDSVREEGDPAVRRFSLRFDGVSPKAFRVRESEFRSARREVPARVVRAIERACERIYDFHIRQKREDIRVEEGGNLLMQRIDPIENVGIYGTGGLAPYPSTVLMDAVPAKVAGCANIVLCSPPKKEYGGGITPVILVAAEVVGVKRAYKVGGAQAIAALAHGTKSIPKVDMICGPGNAYVTEAKRIVQGTVKIDTLAGPTEVLVIADSGARPDYVAADLLAQLEHGAGASAILVSPSTDLFDAVEKELRRQVGRLDRKKALAEGVRRNCYFVAVDDLADACRVCNAVAPEHVEILTARPTGLVRRIRHAGAIFVGPYSPEPLGDYMAGPNHVLPTGGCARFSSALGVDDFVKKTTVIRFSRRGLSDLAESISDFAGAEGFDAHAGAVRIRFPRKE